MDGAQNMSANAFAAGEMYPRFGLKFFCTNEYCSVFSFWTFIHNIFGILNIIVGVGDFVIVVARLSTYAGIQGKWFSFEKVQPTVNMKPVG